jgi:di/tricarboxylate transporter
VRYHINFLEALKQDTRKKFLFTQSPNTNWVTVNDTYIIDAGDKLIVSCDTEEYEKFIAATDLNDITEGSRATESLDKIQLAEVILTPGSSFLNKSLAENHFRHKFRLTVIALKHQYHDARIATKDDTLKYGDTLLVHGSYKDIQLLAEEKEEAIVLTFTGLQNVAPEDTSHVPIAGAVLFAMVVFLIQPWYNISATMVIVIAALIMVLTGCIKQPDHAYRSINWSTIVLIAAMLPMATALQKTNGIDFISNALVESLGAMGPMAILAGLFAITSIFSQFISNTATAVLLYPVAIMTAQQLGVNAYPMVMGVAFSASMAFSTPVATPPNAMVMAAGKYSFFDFVKIGLPMQTVIAVVIVLLIPFFYPF